MLLTKECDYSMRIMRELADGATKTVRTICEKEHIPFKYAYKILKKLHKAGLLQNKRGPTGGYFLAKPLESINMYDVVMAVEQNMLLFECLKDEAQCPNNVSGKKCNVHTEITRLQNLLESEMKSKNLAEYV
ncbi:MAG: Rrf2 family transcriptional regulator [Defluviitaleaceae bacterium]|nr:Rrf2 family transcriptional regulator [Defluviitaleaceae bacterium]